MRTRFVFTFAIVLALAACAWMPKLDAEGQPVLDPVTGEPVVELVLDEPAIGAASMLLPPPFNLLIPGVLGIMSMLRKETK